MTEFGYDSNSKDTSFCSMGRKAAFERRPNELIFILMAASASNRASVSDHNYRLLVKLVDRLGSDGELCLTPNVDSGNTARLAFRVVERRRYTDILSIVLDPALGEWTLPIELELRMYRDLRCAEVVKCDGERLREHYPCPNSRMFAPMEKAQLNRWLGEWLQYWHKGMSRQPASEGRPNARSG